jgi:hypothetical protein
MQQAIFHLAFPVGDIPRTKAFYADGLGCALGRETAKSAIFNLYGNQLVAHVTQEPLLPPRTIYPRHFGLAFTEESSWASLLARAEEQQLEFYERPKLRFAGSPVEHRTFFLLDPFYNLLEFKVYKDIAGIFAPLDFARIGDDLL